MPSGSRSSRHATASASSSRRKPHTVTDDAEDDVIDLSFLDSDEDIAAVIKQKSRSHSTSSKSSRHDDRRSSSQRSSRLQRGRNDKPSSRSSERQKETRDPPLSSSSRPSSSFVPDNNIEDSEDEQDELEQLDDSDDDEDGPAIDDIIAAMNGGGRLLPSPRNARKVNTVTRSRVARPVARPFPTPARPKPRMSHAASIYEGLQDELDELHASATDNSEDISEGDDDNNYRRRKPESETSRGSRRNPARTVPARTSRQQPKRTRSGQTSSFVVEEDDEEDEDDEFAPRERVVGRRIRPAARNTRSGRLLRAPGEISTDDEDDIFTRADEQDIYDVESESESDDTITFGEEDDNDEDDDNDASYGPDRKRKRRTTSTRQSKRLKSSVVPGRKGTRRVRTHSQRRPSKRAIRPAAPVRMRFALQQDLPEPYLDEPQQVATFEVLVDTPPSSDLEEVPFVENIEPVLPEATPNGNSAHFDDEFAEQQSGSDSELLDDFDSDDLDAYEAPVSVLDRHWQVCKRCRDPPALPAYNKAVHTLKRLRKRAANKALANKEGSDADEGKSRIGGRERKRFVEDVTGHGTAVQRAEEWLEVLEDRAGWLECAKCSVAWHWGCLSLPVQRGILADINIGRTAQHRAIFGSQMPAPPLITEVGIEEVIDSVTCPDCEGPAGVCMVCRADAEGKRATAAQLGWTDELMAKSPAPPADLVATKLFRCARCSRCAHYECMAKDRPELDGIATVAETVQKEGWLCKDCHRWGPVETIVAWRPLNPRLWSDETMKERSYAELSPKEALAREYLVKFKDVSYRNVEWVPHDWLSIVSTSLLGHYLRKGSRLELEAPEVVESVTAVPAARRSRASLALGGGGTSRSQRAETPVRQRTVKRTLVVDDVGEVDTGPPGPLPDADRRIPKPWKTPDRILAVTFHASVRRCYHDEEVGGEEVNADELSSDVLNPMDYLRTWPHIAKILVKWQDQPYEGSTWEALPTRRKQPDIFHECQDAYRAFLAARKLVFPALTKREIELRREQRQNRAGARFRALDDQPTCVEGGDLIDFQLEGVNWLRYGWYNSKPGILADEMGLGKTVQIITFLASIWKECKAGPFLIVVPNSTLPNWMREFEKWMPQFRVVPYWGEQQARKMIAQYEFFHSKRAMASMGGDEIQPIKFHVVVASDTSVRVDPGPLRRVERWDVVIVDEGQNLKSGKSVLLRHLNDLRAEHRVIMSGTPLNNNVTELFNLLNWLEPRGQWHDIKALEAKYSVLRPEVIEELQTRLRPYFLRRLKSEVLDLPPKVELIVPTSLRPIQKSIYRSILLQNIEDIQALAQTRDDGRRPNKKKATVTTLNNILMQLRKCIQHPYLIAPDLETREDEEDYEATWEHQRLIDASAKLSLLARLLPKLKARGHRVLLFSQFVINLDIVEVFLRGEGYKFLRLDGQIGGKQRQKGIDAFNDPNSPYFIYMISTRAGGVGINLATADTVIIFDPDFNPHIDMQAIARAHRIGQNKKVLVFTLMCKGTAEERIIEAAKRKMMLDHLIVQNLNNEDDRPEELESILKFGAQALFAEGGTEESEKDIRYTNEDLDKLLDRRDDDDEAASVVAANQNAGAIGGLNTTFSYARVWERDQTTTEVEELPTAEVDDDFWSDLLDKHREEQAKKDELDQVAALELKRAARRDKIKAIFEKEAADKQLDTAAPASRGRGRPKKVRRSSVDADWNAATAGAESESDGDLTGMVAEDLSSTRDGSQSKRKQSRSAKKSAAEGSSSSSDPPPSAWAYTKIRESLRKETRLPPPELLNDVNMALPKTSIRPGHLAAMRQLLLELPVDDSFTNDVITRARSGEPPNLLPPHQRFQLTLTHIKYYVELFKVPRALFVTAFTIVPEESIPAQIRSLPYGGATALDWQKIRETLVRSAVYMLLALLSPKTEAPWSHAIEAWQRRQPIATKPTGTAEAAAGPSSSISSAPMPANILNPVSLEDAAAVLSDNGYRSAWFDQFLTREVSTRSALVRLARLAFMNPDAPASRGLVLQCQRLLKGEAQGMPNFETAELAVKTTLPSGTAFSDAATEVGGATPGSPAKVGSAVSPKAPSSNGGTPKPTQRVSALSRLSAFASGSPVRVDFTRKDLKGLDVEVAVDHRRHRAKTAPRSSHGSVAGGSPRSSVAPSASPAPSVKPFTQGSPSSIAADTSSDSGSQTGPDQVCIICNGPFHFLNRCAVMQDITLASQRWHQLNEVLRTVLADPSLINSAGAATHPDTLQHTIRVMSRKLNPKRIALGQPALVPPF
ncbi:hypothetical protein BCV70DRAFT_167309 [Testicularia cyperi]|uniref:Uncharacterized protein n=1 Tax=Testicularia cyperi TaxID=1882483 RepID=A0A317XFW3_9BASI|nr:hypothetical protein BCV70DRAFT_167309 [Testicularia cyperi]